MHEKPCIPTLLCWFRAVEKALAANQNILLPNTFDLKAPIYNPEKLICVGLNYRDHCEEQNVQVPKEPLIFSKFSSAITEPNGHVELSDLVKVKLAYKATKVVTNAESLLEISLMQYWFYGILRVRTGSWLYGQTVHDFGWLANFGGPV